MEHLIDKDALVAEIERRIKVIPRGETDKRLKAVYGNEAFVLNDLLSFINTLEVKEADLEEELESFAYTLPHSAIGDGEHLGKFDDPKVKEARKHGWSHMWRYNYVKEIAKHFFELGMRVNNPITAADRGTAEEIIINLKRVEKDYRIDLTKEIKWLRDKVKKG